MHRHLHLVRAVEPQRLEQQRPAKVVQLEARRQARLEAARAEQARKPNPRPAA